MHSPLISKIRCHNPNQKKSKVCNRNYLVYIATREGVDLTSTSYEQAFQNEIQAMEDPAQQTAAPNDLYIKYIAERPRSNGLFGNIDQLDPTTLGNHLADLTASGRNIYRGIVSLSGQDALELGYDQKESWERYMHAIVPDVAAQFNIPVDKLQWAAAVHMEKSHPHCHYMFWSSEAKVRSPYIHEATQNKCREILSKEMFKAEREQEVINKTTARDLLLDLSKKSIKSDFDQLKHALVPGTSIAKIPGRIKDEMLDSINSKLLDLIDSLPSKGRINYTMMPPEIKLKIDDITKLLLSHPDFKKEYATYIQAAEKITKTYSPIKSKQEYSKHAAERDMYKRIGNIILSSAKTLKQELNSATYEQRKLEYQKQYQEYLTRSSCYSLCRSVLNMIANENHKRHIEQDLKEHSTSRESRIDHARKTGKRSRLTREHENE